MMQFSKKSQYGLVAMIYLAENFQDAKKYCSLREVSEERNISFSYLEKILLKLEKRNLIESKKGVKGGYRLQKPPQEIKISEIIKSLEGSIGIIDCIHNDCDRRGDCKAIKVWEKIQKALDQALSSITLKSLIK
jgi:Rrf2 family protein